MKYAQFRHAGSPADFTHIYPETYEKYGSAIRISEYVEIEFVPRPPEDTVPQELAAIDKAIADTREEMQKKILRLEEQRANLLSLPVPK